MKKTHLNKIKPYIYLNLLLICYSAGGIFSKSASHEPFLSFKFCLFYGATIFILLAYAIMWQKVIKKIPLVTAYANKGITVVWGILWGFWFFGEVVTLWKVVGTIIIICGIYLVVTEKDGA